MPFVPAADLETFLESQRVGLETIQSGKANGYVIFEEALATLLAAIPAAVEVADGSDVATVLAALKTLGLLVDPAP